MKRIVAKGAIRPIVGSLVALAMVYAIAKNYPQARRYLRMRNM
jgi:hypothetical protein